MNSYLDSRLSHLKAYIPGEQPEPGKFIKINTNEFPYSAPDSVSNAAKNAVVNMNLYCDLDCKELKKEFEKVFGFGRKNVVFTNGSDEALYLSFLAFCGKDKGVAFADITYGFYSVYADLCCLDKKIIPLDNDFTIDPSDYYDLDKTIFIANPNAPTGLKLTLSEISDILDHNKENIVVIDEAYADFSGETCTVLLEKYPNLIVIGTFSKSRGMAGARLGYLIASEAIVADIEKVKYSINPYNVNSLTQAVGTAVLKENEYYVDRVKEICVTRDLFIERLRRAGFEVLQSYTNFVFVRYDGADGEEIADKLREKGILIRHFNNDRIKNFVRISIGTPEQMDTVFTELSMIVGGKNENC